MPFGSFFKSKNLHSFFYPSGVELMLFLHATYFSSLSFDLDFTKNHLLTYLPSLVNIILRHGFIVVYIIYTTDVELPGMNVLIFLKFCRTYKTFQDFQCSLTMAHKDVCCRRKCSATLGKLHSRWTRCTDKSTSHRPGPLESATICSKWADGICETTGVTPKAHDWTLAHTLRQT